MSNKYAIDIDVEKILEEGLKRVLEKPSPKQKRINPTQLNKSTKPNETAQTTKTDSAQEIPEKSPEKTTEKTTEEISKDNKKVAATPAKPQKPEQQAKSDNKNIEKPEEDSAANAVKKYSQYYNYNIKTIGAYLRDLVKYSKKWADFYEKNGLSNFGSKLREMQSTLGTLGGGIQGAYFDPNTGTAENIEGEEFEQVGGGAVAIPKGATAKPKKSTPKPKKSTPKPKNSTQAVSAENPQVQQATAEPVKQEIPATITAQEPAKQDVPAVQEPVQQQTSQTVDPAGAIEQNIEVPSEEQPGVEKQKIQDLDGKLKTIGDNNSPLKQFDSLKNLMREIVASQGPIEPRQSEKILGIIGKNLEAFSRIKAKGPKKHPLMQNIIDTLTSFITSRGIFVVGNLDEVKPYIGRMIEILDGYKPEKDVVSPSEDSGKGQSYSGSLELLKQQLEKWNPADTVIQENYNANSIRIARTIRRMIKKMV